MDRETIMQALGEQHVLQITDVGGGVHVVQPHAILRKGDGTEILECYQLRGFDGEGPDHGWRHFPLGRIHAVMVMPEQFETRRDFRPVSGRAGVVVAQAGSEASVGL